MSNKSRLFLLIPIFLFILINSCDDNVIIFDPHDSGINYFEQSFILNLEKSPFENNPTHHIDDSLFNQGLAPRLYLGDNGSFGEENISYVLFQIDSDIIHNYSICDSSLISIDDIIFTLKFDDPIYDSEQYISNNDSSATSGYQPLNNNANYNFDNIEENIDSSPATPFYINSYFFDDSELSNLTLENVTSCVTAVC